jgi:hypothetical protein
VTCVYAAPRSSLRSCEHNMRRRLRCHRLLAYDIACRPIAGPTILVPSPQHLSQKQKFAAPCTYGEFSDAKKNVGVLLVAVLGCATCLVSSYLATKVITAAYICRSTLSCGPEVHEAVYRYTYNVDLTTPNASSSYRIYNIHSTFELPVSTYLPLTPPSKHQRGICITLSIPGRSSRFGSWPDKLTPFTADLCAAQLALKRLIDGTFFAGIQNGHLIDFKRIPALFLSLLVDSSAAASGL